MEVSIDIEYGLLILMTYGYMYYVNFVMLNAVITTYLKI